ncbi:MAG: phosphoglycolate phosphatase [Vibrio sp.]
MAQIKLVVFDLDGTLLNSVPDLAVATDLAMKAMGRTGVTQTQVAHWIGNGADILMARALSQSLEPGHDITHELIEQAHTLFDQYYSQGGHLQSHLYPNVTETLELLKSQGISLALLTNKPSQFVPDILKHHGIYHYFDAIIGGDTYPKKKPDPYALLLLAEQHQIDMQNMLMVGDSKNDIQAAKNAGCLSLGLTYGYNHGEPISLSEPDYIADNLNWFFCHS